MGREAAAADIMISDRCHAVSRGVKGAHCARDAPTYAFEFSADTLSL